MPLSTGFELLLPAVANWLRATFGEPTPPQRLGWPAIASGQKMSSPPRQLDREKTLAASLACLDHLWAQSQGWARGPNPIHFSAQGPEQRHFPQPPASPGGDTRDVGGRRGAIASAVGRRPDRRHAVERASADAPQTSRHPDHDARIFASDAHESGTKRPWGRSPMSSMPTKSTCALPEQARRFFVDTAGTPRSSLILAGFRDGSALSQRPKPLPEEVANYLGGLRRDRRGWSASLRAFGRSRSSMKPVVVRDLDSAVIAPFDRSGPRIEGSIWPVIERQLFKLIEEASLDHRMSSRIHRLVVERLTKQL